MRELNKEKQHCDEEFLHYIAEYGCIGCISKSNFNNDFNNELILVVEYFL